jgi:hypothetical protein
MNDHEDNADRVIDDAIRNFNREEPQSYEHWDHELERVGRSLEPANSPLRTRQLGSVLAMRIFMAFEKGKMERVIALSEIFVRDVQVDHPSWGLVIKQRAHALHAEGSHDQEVAEVLAAVRRREIHSSEYLYLIADLSGRHPGLTPDTELIVKMEKAVELLSEKGYGGLLPVSTDPGSFQSEVHRIVSELKRINRAKGLALLTGEK